jgi:hypothetical protein
MSRARSSMCHGKSRSHRVKLGPERRSRVSQARMRAKAAARAESRGLAEYRPIEDEERNEI